jgi:hypothetical protein
LYESICDTEKVKRCFKEKGRNVEKERAEMAGGEGGSGDGWWRRSERR